MSFISTTKAYYSRNKRTLFLVFRIAVVALCLGFVWKSLNGINGFDFLGLISESALNRFPWLAASLALVLLNWGLEALKWQYLMKEIQILKFPKAFAAVLTGVTFSTFTPNRTGEFVGRILLLEDKVNPLAIIRTLLGSLSQVMITALIGLPCVLFFMEQNTGFQVPAWVPVVSTLVACLIALVFWCFPVLTGLLPSSDRFPRLRKLRSGLHFVKFIQLLVITGISLLRYIVFCIQFYLVLRFFAVPVSTVQAAWMIPAVFFIQSLAPSFAIAEIGVRMGVAVLVIGSIGGEVTGIVSSTALLWIINLMLPALAGSLIILRLKYKSAQ